MTNGISAPSRRRGLVCILVFLLTSAASCGGDEIPVQVKLTRSVSKLPFVIALDQGLYRKYGLDIEVRLDEPDFDGGIRLPSKSLLSRVWRRIRLATGSEVEWSPEIVVNGANYHIIEYLTKAKEPHRVSIAATDCIVRQYVVGNEELQRVEDLKGKRIGITSPGANSEFVARSLAERMGWDIVQDISLVQGGNKLDDMRLGRVDAVIGTERLYARAIDEGLPILVDGTEWNEPMAGNSVLVPLEWMEDPFRRETARRFLKATIEGIALFHRDRELALKVLRKWHGVADRSHAEKIYDGGQWIPHKPYPCYEGIERGTQRYDSNEMRKFKPEDFYDDSLIRELDESGFIAGVYAAIDAH